MSEVRESHSLDSTQRQNECSRVKARKAEKEKTPISLSLSLCVSVFYLFPLFLLSLLSNCLSTTKKYTLAFCFFADTQSVPVPVCLSLYTPDFTPISPFSFLGG